MSIETDNLPVAKRKLIVHDALIFAVLSLITVVLFAVTLFLFRSFAAHRDELATRWSGRGEVALVTGHPDQAIVALRTALLYAPGQRAYELLLAQALGDAGHTEESYNYFMGLWAAQPGDGFINLRLARLEAKKGDRKEAVKFYRASIYGTWEGDGAVRRRDVRLELGRYLLDQHAYNNARTELLIAGGNNPDDPALTMMLAGMLEEAKAPTDALAYYQKVVVAQPKNEKALEAAGRLELAAGRFEDAHRLLERADTMTKVPVPTELTSLLAESEQVLELIPAKRLPVRERVNRIEAARRIAKKRFEDCLAQVPGAASSMGDLTAAWTGKAATAGTDALLQDMDAQDAAVKLVFDTEMETNDACGAPSGDDALLLLMAQSPDALKE